jgi:chromosome segregation ATPase
MGMKETIIEALKDLVLPELDEIKGEVKRNGVRLDAVERRLDDFASRFQGIDQHLLDQSRRIDATNQRIDQLRADLTTRIDTINTELTARIDKVNTELADRIDRVNMELTARIDQQAVRIDRLNTDLVAQIEKVDTNLTARIDQQATRIDGLTGQVSALAQQMAGLRSDREVQADILERLRQLEEKATA